MLLGALGLDFRRADPPASPIAGAQYFSKTGHNLSGKFKEYWDTHGGLFVHGYPITEAVMERSTNGKEYLVQWFERSRIELHPENAGSPYEVLLGVLGRQLSEKKGFPYGWYPLFGRAPDYSWIAGNLFYYNPDNCAAIGCGCVLFVYDEHRDEVVQAVRFDVPGSLLIIKLPFEDINGKPFVFFGRMAAPGEQYQPCVAVYRDPNYPPGYLVRQWQLNPAR